jgi:hypothetical protein
MCPPIAIRLPTEAEEDLHRRFTVNRHYLQATRQFLETTYGKVPTRHSNLRVAVESRQSWEKIQRKADPGLDDVRRFLMLGWTSEAQLQLPSTLGEGAPVGHFNAWAPVQAYYAVYGVMQAWFASNGIGGLTDDHTAALKTISAMIRERDPFPPPWNLLAVGCPMRDERHYLNEPAGFSCATSIELLTVPTPLDGPAEFWPRYGTWLRATRKARLLRREESWKKKNGKTRISPQARSMFAKNLAPTSFFDCLWRMRIRANYGSADQFISSFIPESEHRLFHWSLRECVDATAGLLELYVARKIGRKAYAAIADEFISNDGAGAVSKTLRTRSIAYGLI